MSKTKKILILSGLLFIFGFFSVHAQTTFTFTKNLVWGMRSNADVAVLQQFLANRGFYAGPITGNFFLLTYEALVKFQKSESVRPASGYFGALSRADANILLARDTRTAITAPAPTLTAAVPELIDSFASSLEARAGAAYNQIMQLRNLWTQGRKTFQPAVTSAQAVTLDGGTPVIPASSGTGSSGSAISGGGGGSSSGGGSPAITTPPQATTTPPKTPPATTTPPVVPPLVVPPAPTGILWGAYVGDGSSDLSNFEALVGKPVNLYADFEGWDASFPSALSSNVGSKGKTLIIFWEPNFGYDAINNGSEDSYISQFAAGAKAYGAPVILVPFDEMNLNENAWGYGQNGNTAAKFVTAWRHIHDLFASSTATNVKFGIAYNNVSVPQTSGNGFSDYYPGAAYVDYVGVDGFNFGNPWQSFDTIFSSALNQLRSFNKPIYIFSMGSVPGSQKAAWIADALNVQIAKYPIAGWVWFNQNGSDGNWLVNSDAASLAAFKAGIPN